MVVEGGRGDTEANGGGVPDGMARAVDEPEVACSGMELKVGSGVNGGGTSRPDRDASRVDNGSQEGRRGVGGVEGYEAEGEVVVWGGPDLACVGSIKG